MLVTVLNVPKGSNPGFEEPHEDWQLNLLSGARSVIEEMIKINPWEQPQSSSQSTMRYVFSLPSIYLMAKKGQASIARDLWCTRNVALWSTTGEEKTTQSSLHPLTEINQRKRQELVWGGVICRNHLISGKIKQTSKVYTNIPTQEQPCDPETQRHADFGKHLLKNKRCQCQSCSCNHGGASW